MTFVHCGIVGQAVKLKDGDVHCNKCCFDGCEVDCMDIVPCKLGMYYREIKAPDEITKLLSTPSPRLRVEKKVRTNDYVGVYDEKEVCRCKTSTQVRVKLLRYLKNLAVQKIKDTEYKTNNKGKYSISHKQVVLSCRKSLPQARKKAIDLVKMYYDYLISLEGL